MNNVKIFAQQTSWIEGEAIRQLNEAGGLPGMISVFGMPDAHPSKGCAVGAVSISSNIIYPHLIGNDIGCGYSLFETDIPSKRLHPDKLAEKLRGLDSEYIGAEARLESYGLLTDYVAGLGTVGGGNHFAELQRVVNVTDSAAFNALGIDTTRLVLLVHSGSRGLGESIFQKFAALCGNRGFQHTDEHYQQYITAHDNAVQWAAVSREIIAERLLNCLNTTGRRIIDLPHNFVEINNNQLIHRKGAAPSDRGISPLPGSRGTSTYLLNPSASDESSRSLAHGAGRKTSRANMHGKFQQSTKQLINNNLGGVVVCGNSILLEEEHPSAYKNVDKVLDDLKAYDLALDIAELHPVITYKSEPLSRRSDISSKREKEEGWRTVRRDSVKRRV